MVSNQKASDVPPARRDVTDVLTALKGLDKSGLGTVSLKQLQTVIKKLSPGMSGSDVYDLIAHSGAAYVKVNDFIKWLWKDDQNGKPEKIPEVGQSQFQKSVAAARIAEKVIVHLQQKGTSLQSMFDQQDKNGKGYLTSEEFRKLMLNGLHASDEGGVDFIVERASRGGTVHLCYDTVFKELMIEFVAYRLQQNGISLRKLFRELDSGCYGFIPTAELHTLLLKHGLSSAEADSFVAIVDKNGDGAVEYSELFDNFWSTSHTVAAGKNQTTLRAAIIVARHGARYPLKTFPRSTHWPKSEIFWEGTPVTEGKGCSSDFKGRLTPVGVEQHTSLGRDCRRKYIDHGHLLDVNSTAASKSISAYTSNSDRTLKSAQAFLNGMFPEIPPRFEIEKEDILPVVKKEKKDKEGKVKDKNKEKDKEIDKALDRQATMDHRTIACQGVKGILITVCSEGYTPLLHGFKCSDEYDKLRKEAFDYDKQYGEISQWAKDQEYITLLEKLFSMTGFKKIAPSKGDIAERLSHMQSIAQSMGIERAHHMPLLWNDQGLVLTHADEEIIRMIAGHVCRLRYCGIDMSAQLKMARLAAGLLPQDIVNRFRRVKADAKSQAREFRFYSAHDNTIMAMLAHLGFYNFPVPEFAAFLAFELHETEKGDWYVRFTYNPDPKRYTFPEVVLQGLPANHFADSAFAHEEDTVERKPLRYVRLPVQKTPSGSAPVSSFDAAEEGDMSFSEFEEVLMGQRGSVPNQEAWDAENPSGLSKTAMAHELDYVKQEEEHLMHQLELAQEMHKTLEKRMSVINLANASTYS